MTTSKSMKNSNIHEEKITIGITNFNGEGTVCKTIESTLNLDYKNFRLIIVDDCSSDNSLQVIFEKYPHIEVIKNKKNLGLSAVRNIILKASDTNLVFIIDNDITLEPDCLSILVKEINDKKDAIIMTPRILYADGKRIYSDGTRMHYIGAAIHYNKDVLLRNVKDNYELMQVESGSGGMMLIDKQKAEILNLFDEDFRFGWTDGEFMFRATLSGMKCYNVPKALVYHHHKSWGTKRAMYQLRNRWFVILITYSLRTLFVISPMLIFYEMFLAVFMLMKKSFNDYVKSWVLLIKDVPKIMKKRKFTQLNRVLADGNFLSSGLITVDKGLVQNKLLSSFKTIMNKLLDIYWQIAINLGLIIREVNKNE